MIYWVEYIVAFGKTISIFICSGLVMPFRIEGIQNGTSVRFSCDSRMYFLWIMSKENGSTNQHTWTFGKFVTLQIVPQWFGGSLVKLPDHFVIFGQCFFTHAEQDNFKEHAALNRKKKERGAGCVQQWRATFPQLSLLNERATKTKLGNLSTFLILSTWRMQTLMPTSPQKDAQ